MTGIFRNDRVMASLLSGLVFFLALRNAIELASDWSIGGCLLAASTMMAAVLIIRSIWRDRA